jgi:hypothetical protein
VLFLWYSSYRTFFCWGVAVGKIGADLLNPLPLVKLSNISIKLKSKLRKIITAANENTKKAAIEIKIIKVVMLVSKIVLG